ncbi:MAG: branched-chain amino acid transaminase [Anaerolineae bacterium]|nr:branched-chain amino acid transaminase [Anaerolineae bacterium]
MPIKESEWIWFDGDFVPWADAKVHVLSHALHYGSSVFEGIRAYKTPQGVAVFRLAAHVKRLFNSCKIAHMPVPYTAEQTSQAIVETVRRNKLSSCYIRPLVFRGYEVLGVDPRSCPVHMIVAAFEWGTYLGAEAIEQGVDVGISSWRRMAPDTFPSMAKIGGHYVNSQFMVMEARDRGFSEAIGLDIYGYVSEGSGENLFVVVDGIIYTPPLGASILGGITRDSVITIARDLGYEVREQLIPREMLYIADEVFFTGTAAEVTPIRSVDGQPVGEGHRGPITAKIQEQFFGITQGKLPDRYHWLHYV